MNIFKRYVQNEENRAIGKHFCDALDSQYVCVDPITQDIAVLNRTSTFSTEATIYSSAGKKKYQIPSTENWRIIGMAFTENLIYLCIRNPEYGLLVCTREGEIVTSWCPNVPKYLFSPRGIGVDIIGNIYFCLHGSPILMFPQNTEEGVQKIGSGILYSPIQIKVINEDIFVSDYSYTRMSMYIFNSMNQCLKKMEYYTVKHLCPAFDVDRFGNFIMCTSDSIEKWDCEGKVDTIDWKDNTLLNGKISCVAIDDSQRIFYGVTRYSTTSKYNCIMVYSSKS